MPTTVTAQTTWLISDSGSGWSCCLEHWCVTPVPSWINISLLSSKPRHNQFNLHKMRSLTNFKATASMWQVYYCNAPPPGVSQTTYECFWNPNLGNGRPLKFVRLALSFWVRTVWIIFTARWPACISVASPCWCMTLVQPWALDNWHCRISEDILLQVPPSCCSSANFTCPDLGLNPTAVLPQVDQHPAATHCSFSNLTAHCRWSLVASLFCWRVQCPLLQPLLQWLLFSSWQAHCWLVAWQGTVLFRFR